jgi:large subunit ribosomal protein L18e
MVSKRKINIRMKKKTNVLLAEAIYLAKKKNLLELAEAISVSTRKQASINLNQIENLKSAEIIVPGKVLGSGEINRKVKLYAFGFTEEAKKKLKKAGCEFKTIYESLKKGEKLKGEILS